MAQDAYPVPGRTTSLVEFRAMARTYASEIATGLEVFADSTGRHVKVRSGTSMVDGIFYSSTAVETLPIGANTSGNARKDAVVLRLDPAASPLVQMVVIPGVPSASPVEPALTRNPVGVWEVLQGVVTVPAGAVTIAPAQVVARLAGNAQATSEGGSTFQHNQIFRDSRTGLVTVNLQIIRNAGLNGNPVVARIPVGYRPMTPAAVAAVTSHGGGWDAGIAQFHTNGLVVAFAKPGPHTNLSVSVTFMGEKV